MSWTVRQKGEDTVIDCNFQPYCEICERNGWKVFMKLFMIKFLNFELEPESGNFDSYALDHEMRCPSCGFREIFGVAVSEKEFKNAYDTIKKPE